MDHIKREMDLALQSLVESYLTRVNQLFRQPQSISNSLPMTKENTETSPPIFQRKPPLGSSSNITSPPPSTFAERIFELRVEIRSMMHGFEKRVADLEEAHAREVEGLRRELELEQERTRNSARSTPPNAMIRCAICNRQAQGYCSVCKTAHYCSRTCRLKDWPTHKVTCVGPDLRGNGGGGDGIVHHQHQVHMDEPAQSLGNHCSDQSLPPTRDVHHVQRPGCGALIDFE